MRRLLIAAAWLSALAAGGAAAAAAPHPVAEAQALELAEKAIALHSVAGPGNETPKVARLYADALIAGGFRPEDVTITPMDGTAYLIARWRGSDPSLKPLVISGHMDVVEAKPRRLGARPVHAGGGERLPVRPRRHRHEARRARWRSPRWSS